MWTTTPDVTDQQKETARVILGAMGKEFYARDEGWLDMATAVSGSGPAYLFYYIEAMTDAAVKIGLPRDTAKQMVLGTVLGSAHLLAQSGKEPAELRKMVTSPGGTTAEAIQTFEKKTFPMSSIKLSKPLTKNPRNWARGKQFVVLGIRGTRKTSLRFNNIL